VRVVLIDHAGERGFCAGGDIAALSRSAAEGGAAARAFFHTEYRLNHLLAVFPKPVVTFMHGVTMGGGVGISMPARFRIATEKTLFAMPECGIGLFPDVGGGWWLSRLEGNTGLWLALTGARLKGADCLALGIATHYVESQRLEALKAAIASDPERLEHWLDQFSSEPGPSAVEAHRPLIDRLFEANSVEEIIERLRADPSSFAADALSKLVAQAPLSLKVSFRLLQEGARLDRFEDEMATEFRLATRVVMLPDFTEGVRAVLVDKDNRPKWSPASLDEVGDDTLDEIFGPLGRDEEWTPLN
jgi:enoyl-CoA hydratase